MAPTQRLVRTCSLLVALLAVGCRVAEAQGAPDGGAPSTWSNARLARAACPRAIRCGAPANGYEGCCVGCRGFAVDIGRARAIAVLAAPDCAAVRALWHRAR